MHFINTRNYFAYIEGVELNTDKQKGNYNTTNFVSFFRKNNLNLVFDFHIIN